MKTEFLIHVFTAAFLFAGPGKPNGPGTTAGVGESATEKACKAEAATGTVVRTAPREIQVGPGGASTVFSYYNTSPESPDGQNIAYVRCELEPRPGRTRVPATLWVCDRDLKHHRKVANITSISVHDGAEVQWVDNHRVALFDNRVLRVVDIRSGKDLLEKKLAAAEIGHDTHNGKLLFAISEGKVPGTPGIYELNCNTGEVRAILYLGDCGSARLPAFLRKDEILPVSQWKLSHCQYSPDGQQISFRMQTGEAARNILLGVCNLDGSDLKVSVKPLHFLWYDNASIIGNLRFDPDGNMPEKERRFSLTRWDLEGNVIQRVMAPRGNHLALSPDKKHFVTETFYQTDPVVLTLYSADSGEEPVEICRFDPYELTWEAKFHVNPSFSRDGKRIYYSRPVNEHYNGTFYYEID